MNHSNAMKAYDNPL